MLSIMSVEAEWLAPVGFLLCFALTALMIAVFKKRLPRDQGRKFAVEGNLSEGKARGAGIVFVSVFVLMAAVFCRIGSGYIFYLILIFASMLTGFFDDASEKPWGNVKKGLFDLLISGGTAATYIIYNDTEVELAFFDTSFVMPVWLFAIIATALVWGMINVTNCTDGVDGLSASLTIITLLSFVVMNYMRGNAGNMSYTAILFIGALLAYLLFNANPSTVLMGDAGSRAMGTLIAIMALTSRDLFMVIIFAIVICLDGGLGLLKLFLARTVKIKILKNTRTPLHDHVRKVLNWSNTQAVFRFVIIQTIVSAAALWIIALI